MSRQYFRQQYKKLNTDLAAMKAKGVEAKIMVDLLPILETLDDWRYSEAVMSYLHEAVKGLQNPAEALNCFCCNVPWEIDRCPMALVVVEFINMPSQHAMIGGVCRDCLQDPQANLMRAIDRDFKPSGVPTFIHSKGHA